MAEVPHVFVGGDCLNVDELNENFAVLCELVSTLTDQGLQLNEDEPFPGAIKYTDGDCLKLDFDTRNAATGMDGCVTVAYGNSFASPPNVTATSCEYTLGQTPAASPNELNLTIKNASATGFEICFTRSNGTPVANEWVCFNWQAVGP